MQALSQLSYNPKLYSSDNRFWRPVILDAWRPNHGGATRDRTADLLHAMQALSQLSYNPKFFTL